MPPKTRGRRNQTGSQATRSDTNGGQGTTATVTGSGRRSTRASANRRGSASSASGGGGSRSNPSSVRTRASRCGSASSARPSSVSETSRRDNSTSTEEDEDSVASSLLSPSGRSCASTNSRSSRKKSGVRSNVKTDPFVREIVKDIEETGEGLATVAGTTHSIRDFCNNQVEAFGKVDVYGDPKGSEAEQKQRKSVDNKTRNLNRLPLEEYERLCFQIGVCPARLGQQRPAQSPAPPAVVAYNQTTPRSKSTRPSFSECREPPRVLDDDSSEEEARKAAGRRQPQAQQRRRSLDTPRHVEEAQAQQQRRRSLGTRQVEQATQQQRRRSLGSNRQFEPQQAQQQRRRSLELETNSMADQPLRVEIPVVLGELGATPGDFEVKRAINMSGVDDRGEDTNYNGHTITFAVDLEDAVGDAETGLGAFNFKATVTGDTTVEVEAPLVKASIRGTHDNFKSYLFIYD